MNEDVTTSRFIGFCTFLCVFCFLILKGNGFILFIDHVNLVFHEAGHIIWRILGDRFEVYGGTFNQLLIPFVVALIFLRQGHIVSFGIAMIWFFENFFNIAR